jgi:PAS domain S-box-containing protein
MMSKTKVLIVEDEKIIAKDLEIRLRNMNYEVVASVTNGADAYTAVKTADPDLILMDIMIDGDIDGIETAELIHKDSDVPVVYLTAYADDKTFQRAKLSDPFGYILKPFQDRELDITIQTVVHKHSLEKKLVESEKQYKLLFESNPLPMWIFDLEDIRFLAVNKAAIRVYGYSQEEFLSMTLNDLRHPEEKLHLEEYMQQDGIASRSVSDNSRFIRHKKKDGSDMYVDVSSHSQDFNGRKARIVLIDDITEKVYAEKALKNSETKYRNLFENTTEAILILDDAGKVQDVNSAATRLFGESSETLTSRHISAYFPERMQPEMPDMWNRFKRSGKYYASYEFKRSDGKLKHIDFRAKSDFLPGLHQVVLRDVTEAVTAQAEIQNLAKFPAEAPNPILRIALDGRIVYSNTAAEIVINEWMQDSPHLVPDVIIDKIKELNRIDRQFTISIEAGNRIFSLLFVYIPDAGYINIYGTDITQLKHSEKVVNFQKDILEQIASNVSLKEIMERICLQIQQMIDPGANASILLVDPVSERLILGAAPTLPENFNNAISGLAIGERIGSSGTAVYRKEPVIVSNIAEDPLWEGYRDIAFRSNVKASWSTPVLSYDNEVLATFALYYNQEHLPQSEEATLITIACNLLRIAIERDRNYESLYKQALTFENINDAVVITSLDEKVLEWNPSAEMMFGYSKQEIANKVIYDLLPYSDALTEEVDKLAYANADKVLQEFDFKTQSGQNGIAEVMGVIMKDRAGETVGILRVMRDITQKKLSEKNLKESEERFSKVFQANPTAIAISHFGTGKFIDINQSFTRLTGYEKHEVLGNTAVDLSLWKESKSREQVTSSLARGNTVYNVATEIITKDGRIRYALSSFERIMIGEDYFTVTMMTDVTEQKNAEIELRISEANLSALIENTNDVVFSLDRNFKLITANSAFKKLCMDGFNGFVEQGMNLFEVIPADFVSSWKKNFDRSLNGERFIKELHYDYPSYSADLEISFNPIYTKEGEINGLSVFGRDITQRKISENELKRTNFELDSFVYRASHDLRAPLRSVLGLNNLARIEPDTEQRNHYLKLVEKSINKLDSFIMDLTNFSRNSRLEILVEKIDFNSIINDCIDNLKYMDHADKITPKINIDQACDFYSDPTRIAIVLQNLISNAVKYQKVEAPDSFVLVNIKCLEEGIYLEVRDNGKGIQAGFLEKIFDMFFRASEDSYGSGLGLYITKQVIEKLKGTIKVESEINVGTAFIITLPNLKTAETVNEVSH